MTYTHIIFDLDGTLIDPLKGIRNSFAYAVEKMKLEIDIDTCYKQLIGPPLHEGFSKVLKLNDEEADRGVAFFREYYGKKGLYESALFDGIEKLIEALSSQGKKIYLASSKLEKFAVEILKDKNIYAYFQFIAGASYKGSGAGKEVLIRRVLEHIPETELEQVVMIGDTKFDIQGATLTGINSIGVLYGFGSRKELERAGAGCIVEGVEELWNVL